jgi:hypothetical protein
MRPDGLGFSRFEILPSRDTVREHAVRILSYFGRSRLVTGLLVLTTFDILKREGLNASQRRCVADDHLGEQLSLVSAQV